MLKELYYKIREIMVSFDNEPGGGLTLDHVDKRDFVFSSIFGYSPKKKFVNNSSKSVRTHDQTGQNTCVLESGTDQKEIDEGVGLSVRFPAAYLKKQGLMTDKGTSLSVWQKFLYDIGTCERSLVSEDYSLSWNRFADQSVIQQHMLTNASNHKSGSYGVTYDLDTVLEKIDEGRTLQVGMDWYSGYNQSGGFKHPWIIQPKTGLYRAGHAVHLVGYNLDYFGHEVLILRQSYGPTWGDNGYFYLRFSDFKELAKYGCYFNTDVPKNIAGWTSLNNGRAVKGINDPRVYILEAGKKRHIPDEALMWMLGITPQQILIDNENNLEQVKDGEPISFKEFSSAEIDRVRYFVAMQKDDLLMKNLFSKYFPNLFNN